MGHRASKHKARMKQAADLSDDMVEDPAVEMVENPHFDGEAA